MKSCPYETAGDIPISMNILSPEKHSRFQATLLNFLTEAKLRNPQFGIRAMALKLNLSPGSLSEILSGKRNVSKVKAKEILEKLTINPEIQSKILKENDSDNEEFTERTSINLNLDYYYVLTEWQYFAILNLIETKGFKYNHKHIANRLGLTEEVVAKSFERLFRLEMVEEKRGKIKRTSVRYKTSEDVSNSSIKKFHKNALFKADEALDKFGVDERDYSAMILPIDPKHLPKIKEKTRKFQNQILSEFSDGKATEVFQISMQIFPLTIKDKESVK